MKYAFAVYSAFILMCCSPLYSMGGEIPIWWNQIADEAKKENYSLITPNSLKALYDSEEDFLVVDARVGYEYQQGHLPNAVNFEFDLGDRLQLKQEKQNAFIQCLGTNKDRKIIIYCRNFR